MYIVVVSEFLVRQASLCVFQSRDCGIMFFFAFLPARTLEEIQICPHANRNHTRFLCPKRFKSYLEGYFLLIYLYLIDTGTGNSKHLSKYLGQECKSYMYYGTTGT
jgi:hypothetical protein